MRVYRNVIDTNLPETVRATNLVRLMRLMPEEWESFDQDLAELENAQKQIIKTGGNREMLDKWGNRSIDFAERVANTAYDIGSKVLSGETPYVPNVMEPMRAPFGYMRGEEAPATPDTYAPEAAGDDMGGYGGATGSSITQNPNMSPNTAGWLYQGNTDAALASQFGGQKDGGLIEPLNAPRKMDKKGIISLVS